MLIKKPEDIKSSEITDQKGLPKPAPFSARCGVSSAPLRPPASLSKAQWATPESATVKSWPVFPQSSSPTKLRVSGFTTDEKLTPLENITNYNNFYEFSTDKQGVARAAKGFQTNPWTVSVDGLVNKPTTFGLEELLKFPQEERIYRLRCVERWSMVIPWVGFPLAKLLEKVEPMSQAKYVAFETLFDPKRMPNQSTGVLDWPYVEGLRLDEAMHPLTILATGLYGQLCRRRTVLRFD